MVNDVKDSKFAYGSCVIDLDPKSGRTRYKNLPDGKFPMKFAGKIYVNSNEYKTSKLVLNRIEDFSGEGFVKNAVIGSHETDYKLVTDPRKRQYRDEESIMEGAVDNYATITLGNSGSYQKQLVDVDLHEVPADYASTEQGKKDLYCIEVPFKNADGNNVKVNDSQGRKPGSSGYVTTY